MRLARLLEALLTGVIGWITRSPSVAGRVPENGAVGCGSPGACAGRGGAGLNTGAAVRAGSGTLGRGDGAQFGH